MFDSVLGVKASAISPEQCVCVFARSAFKWYYEIVKRLIYSGSLHSSVDVDGVHVHSSCTASVVMVR